MSTDYRNFLALPYEELEELNLAGQEGPRQPCSADEIREKRLKYLDRREADQGRHRAVL